MNFNSVHKCFNTFFAFAISSFNNYLCSNRNVNNVVIEKKKERRNVHCDTIKIIIFLLHTSYNCFYTAVQRFKCAVVFLFSVFAALLFIFAAAVNIHS